jgi:hypothetical protein
MKLPEFQRKPWAMYCFAVAASGFSTKRSTANTPSPMAAPGWM